MVFSSIRRRLSTTRTSEPSSTTSSDSAKRELPAGERLILVYGNCQAQWLGGVLQAQGLGLVCIVGQAFGFYPEQNGLRPMFVADGEVKELTERARAAGRAVIMLEQTSPMNETLKPKHRKLADRVVRFPHLEMRSYWHPWLTKVGNGFAPERIKRQFTFDMAAIRKSESRAGWDTELSDHIEAMHGQALMFHTLNHPSGDLMARIHKRICKKIGSRKDPLDRKALGQAKRTIVQQDGLHFIMEHPLHDAVIDALELNWARTGWYADWQKGYFAAGAGQHKKARQLLEQALSDPGCDPHVNYTYGQLLEGFGERTAATEAFGRAHRAYPQNPEYARRWMAGFTLPEAGEHPLLGQLNGTFPG